MEARFSHLQQQTAKQRTIVKELENNNNEAYNKIIKDVEAKVHGVLSYNMMLPKLALPSLTGSMRNNPDKYYYYYSFI
jgi:hypothetical protein